MTKSDSSTLIELKNAGVKRAGKWLARGISFSLHAGEIVTLIGPNGAGKTTSAKMALGLLDLDEGTALQKPDCLSATCHKKFQLTGPYP